MTIFSRDLNALSHLPKNLPSWTAAESENIADTIDHIDHIDRGISGIFVETERALNAFSYA